MHGLVNAVMEASTQGKELKPKITTSYNYKHWISMEDPKRCKYCEENHGKIYLIGEEPNPEPPDCYKTNRMNKTLPNTENIW